MKGGKQKISQDTCHHESRAEPEGSDGGQTFIWITENNLTNTNRPGYGLLEQILSPSNLNRAYKRVRSNKGSGGVDKMDVESLKDYLVKNKDQLIQSILDGKGWAGSLAYPQIPQCRSSCAQQVRGDGDGCSARRATKSAVEQYHAQ